MNQTQEWLVRNMGFDVEDFDQPANVYCDDCDLVIGAFHNPCRCEDEEYQKLISDWEDAEVEDEVREADRMISIMEGL